MDVWIEAKGWKYLGLALDEPIDILPVFKPLVALWNDRRDGNRLPAWRDFAFEDFVGWHAHLILYQVMHDPFDLYYRLFGSFAADVYREDFTGRYMRSANPEIEDDYDLLHFEKLYRSRRYGASFGPEHWFENRFIRLSFLDLPLAQDGGEITHFLTCMLREPATTAPPL